jgi:YHS domain-containing protein
MKRKLLLLCSFMVLSLATFSQIGARQDNFNLEKGMIALQGYDPVCYFSQNKPVKGKKEIHLNVMGVNYLFASDANRKAFMKDYKKYEPQYGGWCAFTMATNGQKTKPNPASFKISGGKLYLFSGNGASGALGKWNAAEASLKGKGDKYWSQVFK